MRLRFLHGSGPAAIDFMRVRATFEDWLRDFPGKTGWAAYNPLRPERDQQNRVFLPRPQGDGRALRPVARALYPRFGVDLFDQMRALICDDSTLLAWLGVFQPDAIAGWQHAGFNALLGPLRHRLIVERRLETYETAWAALDKGTAPEPTRGLPR